MPHHVEVVADEDDAEATVGEPSYLVDEPGLEERAAEQDGGDGRDQREAGDVLVPQALDNHAGEGEAFFEDDGGAKTQAASPPEVKGTLSYYNWADYVNPETYKAFTKATGISVKKDFYVSNEALRLARMLAGLMPREPEAWSLVALMELTAARFPARTATRSPRSIECHQKPT